MKTTLYDYQDKTASDIFRRMMTLYIKGAYIGFETGTGKTVTSLSVAERLYNAEQIEGVLVVCPVSKVDDWKRDLKEEVPFIFNTFVVSFQSVWREKGANAVQDLIEKGKILMIVDEGHKMKTYDSKQSKFIQNLSEKNNMFVLILSATPQNKKYIDLYPQYKTLGNPVFNCSPKDFKKKFCIEQLNYNMVYSGKSRFPFNEIIGYRNTEIMDEQITQYTYYKKYESDYDKPIEIVQKFKITPEMKCFRDHRVWPKIDEKVLEFKLKSGDTTYIDTDMIMANRPTLYRTYMRECASGFIKDKFLGKNPKLQWLEDFTEGNEGRFVVFTNFINETKLISEMCDKQKRHWCIYDGSHKDLANWHKYDDCIAIVNVAAGSAGLNDFIKTNIAVYFSPPEPHIDFEQSKGRLDRIGQTKQPVFYYLQIEGGVEADIYKSLAEGKNFDLMAFERWIKRMEE